MILCCFNWDKWCNSAVLQAYHFLPGHTWRVFITNMEDETVTSHSFKASKCSMLAHVPRAKSHSQVKGQGRSVPQSYMAKGIATGRNEELRPFVIPQH